MTKLKQHWKEMQKITTLSELLDYIPHSLLEKCSSLLFCCTAALPSFFFITNCFGLYDNQASPYSGFFTLWVTLIQSIGYLGLIIGSIHGGKSILAAKRAGESPGAFLKAHSFTLIVFLLLCWGCISCIFSTNIAKSFFGDSYRNEGILTYFAYFGYFAMGATLHHSDSFRKVLSFFALLALPIGIGILIETPELHKSLHYIADAGAAVFQNSNHCAYYLCLAIMACATLFISASNKKSPKGLILWGCCFALLMGALLKNRSFGPYLAVLGGLGLMFINSLFKGQCPRGRAALLLALFLATSVGYSLMNTRLTDDLKKLNQDTTAIATSEDALTDTQIGSAGSGRFKLWQQAILMTMDRPLTGWGPDNLGEEYQKRIGTVYDQPHCVPLQIAAQLGIPGLLLYFAAIGLYGASVIRHWRDLTPLSFGVVCMVFAFFLSSLVASSIFHTSLFCLFLVSNSKFKEGLNQSSQSKDKVVWRNQEKVEQGST